MGSLEGQRALVVGVANDQSIAWGCAEALARAGSAIALTYQGERTEDAVRALAAGIGAEIVAPLDLGNANQMAELFREIEARWGGFETLVHSVAFCPKRDLHGRVVDCSAAGFAKAMDVSVHSFLRLLHAAEPLMPGGGSCMTVSYYGAEKVVEHYNVMGPVKAALEAAMRYAAAELGPKGISVNALSPGPLETRAASGIDHFDDLLNAASDRAPTHMLASIEDVGAYCAFLASGAAANVTGGVHHIDGGYHIVG
ncbi:MAG: enoyl-ACP reductase FabI [Pseudomonadota bacterium]